LWGTRKRRDFAGIADFVILDITVVVYTVAVPEVKGVPKLMGY